MNIGIIGAGKVGTTLGKYLSEKGISIVGIYSKTAVHAKETAEFIGTEYYEELEKLLDLSDTLFLTTPDGEIAKVWDCMKEYNLQGKIICHFSGSLSSDVFISYEGTGANVCSVHPIYAFSNKFSAYQHFSKVSFTIEGQGAFQMKKFWEDLGHPVRLIGKQDKIKYHAAMSLASNHVLALIYTAVNLLKECGFQTQEAYQTLENIVLENAKAGTSLGATEALTGPVERNDWNTVEKHLVVLSGQDEKIYRALGEKLLEMADEKHPGVNYGKMREIIGGSKE